MRTSGVVVGLMLVGVANGCDEPDAALTPRPTPDKATASRLMREALETDAAIREKLCGPGTAGLSGLDLNLADNVIPGTFNAEVFASPQAAAVASASAGSVAPAGAPAKRCEGVVAAIFDAVDRKADPIEFKLERLDILEVRTPGLEWKKKGR